VPGAEPAPSAEAARRAERARLAREARLREPGTAGDPAARHRRRAEPAHDRPVASYAAPASGGSKTPRGGRRRRTSFWKELPLLVVVALVLTFLIQTFLAKVYVIPSGSMETTLHGCAGCTNDRVLVDKVSYRFGDPQPGDVVVFRGPDSWRNTEFTVQTTDNPVVRGLQQLGSLVGLAPPNEKDFVKRVIAVGGQTVACCDSANRVVVDGEPLDEPYLYFLPAAGPARQPPFGPISVPEGQLWMMGDSRNNSADSRVPGHGPVPMDNVIGKARAIVLPVGRFGGIDAIDPQPTATGVADPSGVGPSPALGVLGALPLAVGYRRRLARQEAETSRFLPGAPARRTSTRRP
jgi:signal peptidase I